MGRDENRKALAELLAADREKRRVAEAEILRKEKVLLAETARLARLNAENDALDAEIAEAKADAEAEEDAPPGEPQA